MAWQCGGAVGGCGDASGGAVRGASGGAWQCLHLQSCVPCPASPARCPPHCPCSPLPRCPPSCPCPQVHKIGRFTVAQTRSLEQRLQKLQERALVCDTQREKTGLLAVRGGAHATHAAHAVLPHPAAPWLEALSWVAGPAPPAPPALPCLLGVESAPVVLPARLPACLQDAKEIGDEFLALEK